MPRRRSLGPPWAWCSSRRRIVYTVALVAVLIASQQDQRRPVDAIVVLGAAQYNGRPSPVLRARLDHALGLYREGYAPLIVVTGGVGRRRHHQRGDRGPALPGGPRGARRGRRWRSRWAAPPRASMTRGGGSGCGSGAPPGAAGERSLPHVPPPARGPPHRARGLHLAHREQSHLRRTPSSSCATSSPKALKVPIAWAEEHSFALMTLPVLVSSERLYSGRIVNLDLDRSAFPTAPIGQLEMLRHPGAVRGGAVPRSARRTPILACCSSASSATLPTATSGRCPPAGSMPARPRGVRRARAGGGDRHAAPERLERLTTIYTTPGFTDERIHLFLAQGSSPGAEHREADEFMELHSSAGREVLEMIRARRDHGRQDAGRV